LLTLARHRQILRGHDARGWVLWESPVPWESWHLESVGPAVVVSAPDGRAIAYDGTGRALGQARDAVAPGIFTISPEGEVLRIARRGPHLICDDLSGRVRWRALTESNRGPLAAGRSGIATLIGRNLAWFPQTAPAPDAQPS
jgi:hypothetical protein